MNTTLDLPTARGPVAAMPLSDPVARLLVPARGRPARRDVALAAVGTSIFLALARRARRGRVSQGEERLFRMFNALPTGAERPLWVVMQAGSLGGVAVGSAAAAATGRRALGLRLGVVGGSVWVFCKGVKRTIGRGRPSAHLVDVIVRGPAQSGLGFPSGHVAVVFTLAGVAAPELARRVARASWVAAALVAVARQYVGAHLPNDVAGGVALGVAASSAARASRRYSGRAPQARITNSGGRR